MKMILVDVESDEGLQVLTERGEVKLGCEVFPLEVFKPTERLPPRCFKCQRLGHVAKFCKGDETCMRCSEKVTDENKAMHGKPCKHELKYLGPILDEGLTFKAHIETVCSKKSGYDTVRYE